MEASQEISQRFGENLMIYRRRADLSQEELGFRASVHRTEVGQLKRGMRLARIDTVIKLSGALSVPSGDLLKGMAWTPGGPRIGRFLVSTTPPQQA